MEKKYELNDPLRVSYSSCEIVSGIFVIAMLKAFFLLNNL